MIRDVPGDMPVFILFPSLVKQFRNPSFTISAFPIFRFSESARLPSLPLHLGPDLDREDPIHPSRKIGRSCHVRSLVARLL
jgi:hypothetical protein